MAMRAALLAFLLATLAGCAGSLPDLSQAHGPCSAEPGGWCPFTRDLAQESWQFAQMSSDAYCDDTRPFTPLPGLVEVARSPTRETCDLQRLAAQRDAAARGRLKAEKPIRGDRYGFAWSVYDMTTTSGAKRRVIAYRGTDIDQIADWLHGNLGKGQRESGLELYREQRRELDAAGQAGTPIVVTGHSLGGAIALQVSQEFDGVDAYVFNTSPRYILSEAVNANRRVSIAERGDFLSELRRRKRPVRQDALVINCSPAARLKGNHSIRSLAECLTWIAARRDQRAKTSLEANAIKEPPEGELANLRWGLPVESEAVATTPGQ